MALTTIKTGGLADNSVTDAKVADAITVTGAQTGITQVGTLTAGVWNSSTKIASAYLDDDTAHLSGTQTFSGAKTFTANAVFNGEVLVNNTSSGNAKLYIKGGGTSTANSLYITDSAGADILYVKDNKSAKFYGTLETVGNVGIGASASFKFDTQDNSSTWAGRILNTNAGGQGLLVRTDATNGATALGVYANGAYRLTVTDSSSTFAGAIIQDGGDTFAHFGRGDSDSRIILGSQGGTYSSGSTNAFNNFRAHGGGLIFNVASSDDTFVFEHNGTSKLTLSPTTATFAGQVTSTGIKFDASGEVLDSYEEGTFTGKLYSQNPARYYWASDTSANYFQPSTQTCCYVKIGHTVHVWGSMTFTGTNVASYDNIGITHLPFQTVNRSGYVAVGSIFWSKDVPTSADVGAGTMCQLGANTNHMSCGTTGTTSASNYTGNFSLYMNTVTNATVQFSITYETAS